MSFGALIPFITLQVRMCINWRYSMTKRKL